MNEFTIYNDPILPRKRSGIPGDPYKRITETLWVDKGIAYLSEVPNRFDRVVVTGAPHPLYEVNDGELTINTYKVDYVYGEVFFHESLNKKSLTFSYLGTGVLLIPDSRIYLTDDKNYGSAKIKFQDIDRGILEQKNRVDNLIRSTPQPSELVDVRTDRNGKVYSVAKDRVDAEQKKIEDAQVDLNNKKYNSLKERIDAGQKIVQDAFLASNKETLFDNLDERLTHDYNSILNTVDTEVSNILNTLNTEVSKLNKKIERNVNILDYGAVGDGKTNDTKAIQDTTRLVSEKGGGTITFPNGHYIIDVDEFVLYSNVKWSLYDGAVLDVTNTLLRAKATGRGYGNGVTNFSIEGGTVRGNFEKLAAGTVKPSKFLMHHAQHLKFRNVLFYEMAYGHVFDLCGCSDVIFDGCTFQGRYIPPDEQDLDYKECIQIDHSSNTGLGYTDESEHTDGLPTRNVTVRDCQFLPIKKGNSIVYYAPTPMGNHSQFPKAPYNIVFRNNYMESVNAISANDWTEKFPGWVHFSTVRDLIIENNVFNNVTGQRASAFTCRDRQMHFSNEPNIPQTTEYDQIGNITFRDNKIIGFTGQGQVGMVGIVGIKGWYGYKEIKNIYITGNQFIDCGRLRQWRADDKAIECIELTQVKTANVDSNYFYNVDRPIFTGPPPNNQDWVGETNLKFTNNYVDEVGYNTANISHLGGILIISGNTFKNISGSIRVVGDAGKVIIQNNTITTSNTRTLDKAELSSISEYFKDKIFSLSGSEKRVYYITGNVGICDKNVWSYLIFMSTGSKPTLHQNSNFGDTKNKVNV